MSSKFFIIISLSICIACLSSCKENKPKGDIESVRVLYYNGIFKRIVAVSCSEIIATEISDYSMKYTVDGDVVPRECIVLETLLTDKSFLQEIRHELQNVKTHEDYGMDARMKCYINYNDGDTDSICISNSNYAYYNNKPVTISNKLLYLFRKGAGFYKWIGFDEMPHLDELNDTTFVREKVISYSGELY